MPCGGHRNGGGNTVTAVHRAADSYKWQLAGATELPMHFGDLDRPLDPRIAQRLRGRLRAPLTYASPALARATAEVVARHDAVAHGVEVDPERVWFGPSCLSQSYQLMDWLVGPGDEVVVFVPSFYHVPGAVTGAGARVRPVPLRQDGLDRNELKAALGLSTQAIYVVNPHNPTGHVMTEADLATIVDVAREHSLTLVSNELHSRVVFQGRHVPLHSLADDVPCFTLAGASKSHNLAGLGGSFVLANERAELASLLERVAHRYPPATTLQLLGLQEAYDLGNPWLASTLTWLRNQRDQLCDVLAEVGCPGVEPAHATQFQWVDFGVLSGHHSAADLLREQCGLLVGDGLRFSAGPEHVRLTFGLEASVMTTAARRLRTGLAGRR